MMTGRTRFGSGIQSSVPPSAGGSMTLQNQTLSHLAAVDYAIGFLLCHTPAT
jgi:hypothetical protein